MFPKEISTVLLWMIICISMTMSNVLELVPQYSSTQVTLTCTNYLNKEGDYMIHLSCPFVTDGFCYSNCEPNCIYGKTEKCDPNPQLNMISGCEINILPDKSEKSIIYRINTFLINKTGDWRCQFMSYKSNSIPLLKYEVPTTPSTLAITSTKTQIKSKSIDKPSTKEIQTFEPENNNNYIISTEDSPKQATRTTEAVASIIMHHLTRPELVLALVVMLAFSLLLNLSFLIRCVLLKSVVDNYHRGIPNGSCILGCLCIDQYGQQKRYSRSLNLSNQVGSDFYRCQAMSPDNLAIYDDLSAVSNSSARVKLRSNNSYDIDDETRLTNIMSNGGCHINPIGVGSVSTSLPRRYTTPNHAAYFHPGLGNYVIVSGPIPNQDQYTIGTAPPGYTLQMVSPIPSAPGSIVGGMGANVSVQSAHSDDLFDSDNSQNTNSIANQSGKLKHQSAELIDTNKFIDISQTVLVPVNNFNQNRHTYMNNQTIFNRPNGSVPLHPWPIDKVPPPTASSVTSLPHYSVSENGAFVQDMNRSDDPLILNSISITSNDNKS